MPASLSAPVAVWRGDPLTITLNFWTDNTRTTPVDLTTIASAWTSQARAAQSDTDPACTFTIDATNASTGVLALSLTGSLTSGLLQSTYGFDVQGTGGPASPATVIQGTLAVSGDWTR